MEPAITNSSHTQLAEIISRAAALLSDDMADQAAVLADRAYHDAKLVGQLAKRKGAADYLVHKAHVLQGEALLIETRAKIEIANAWDKAEEAGATLKGRPSKSVPERNAFSAEEAGFSRKEIFLARKIRDAETKTPGIVERAIRARINAGFEPTKAVRNTAAGLGNKTRTKEERGLNFHETPRCAIDTLLAVEKFGPLILEPACGRGALSIPIEEAGYSVRLSDIADRGAHTLDGECAQVSDFCKGPVTGEGDVITNPPFNIANQFIAHAIKGLLTRKRKHAPRSKVAMLLNLNFMCGFEDPDRVFCMDDHPPARIYVFTRRLPMMHADDYIGKEASSSMNTAWFVWEKGFKGKPEIIRVDWKNYSKIEDPARCQCTACVERLAADKAAAIEAVEEQRRQENDA